MFFKHIHHCFTLIFVLNLFIQEIFNRNFANSENLDEILQNVAFHMKRVNLTTNFHACFFQLKICFDDHATTTFEYDGEEAALENYLEEHPEEREEALRQEEEFNSLGENVNDDLSKDSPRLAETETLKSNTVIGQPTGTKGKKSSLLNIYCEIFDTIVYIAKKLHKYK